jgi:hypothetical protein
MPRFFPDGSMLAGATKGGQERPTINNAYIDQLGEQPVSSPRPLDNNRIIYSQADGVKILDLTQPLSPTNPQLVFNQEANWVEGADGVWAMRRQSRLPIYLDSMGNNRVTARPLAVSRELGVLWTDYQTGRGLHRFRAEGGSSMLSPIAIYDDDVAVDKSFWVIKSDHRTLSVGQFDEVIRTITVPPCVDIAFSGRYVLVHHVDTDQPILIDIVDDLYAELGLGTSTFNFDLRVTGNLAQVAYATTTGERLGTNIVASYSLPDLQWRRFAGGTVVVPPPPPPVSQVSSLRPHPRPLWLAPYHQITDKWGDSPDAVGNALLVLPEAPDEPIEVYRSRIRRAMERGKPLILSPEGFSREWESLIVAWYFHEPNYGSLQEKLGAYQGLLNIQHHLERPLICYIDDPNGWQDGTDYLPADNVWPSPQLYREQGESLADFRARCESTLNQLRQRYHYVLPTIGAYDRNGQVPVEQMVEAMQVFHELPHEFRVIGYLPFTDMRQGSGVGGMNLHPSLKSAVEELVQMNPEDRPNRFSYWAPAYTPAKVVLNNILSQSRELVQLSTDQKEHVLDLLQLEKPDEPDPDDDYDVSPMRDTVLGIVGNVPRPLPNEGRAFLEGCIRSLGDSNWGLHMRPNGRISTDILALDTEPYRIFDVIFSQEAPEARAMWQEVEQHEIEPGSRFVSVI